MAFPAQLHNIFENFSERMSGISKGVLPGTERKKRKTATTTTKRKPYEISLK